MLYHRYLCNNLTDGVLSFCFQKIELLKDNCLYVLFYYSYRRLKTLTNIDLEGDSPVMGLNLALFTSGCISVGDPVFVEA